MGTVRDLRDFLIDAELDHYYSAFKNELKVASIPQLKYVAEDDLVNVGMTKPEMRRLKKYYKKECPQGKLEKFKRALMTKANLDGTGRSLSPSPPEHRLSSRPMSSYIRPSGKQIISSDSIMVNKTLGEGEFGVVQQGVWNTEDGEKVQVAIKCLSKERLENGTQEFLKEAGLMQTIDHDNVVRMYGVVLDKDNTLMLVTELAPMRSLLECLKETTLRIDFPLPRLCDFAQQVCDGMSYLESKRLIHRDLAARNILVFSKSQVKVSDFGLSRALGVGKDYYQSNFSINLKLPIAWCAPECINYLKFTSASDVWGFGVTLWEMFTYGFQPWAGMTGQQILDAIDSPNNQRLDQPELCPKQFYDLMLSCWDAKPENRPTFSEMFIRLPQMRPTQVKATKDFPEITVPKKYLYYKAYDVIIVIDNAPSGAPVKGFWKGVLNSGKCGFFDPMNVVPFVEPKTSPVTPSPKKSLSRKVLAISESKRASASKKIRTDMISRPQNDLRHTGHIGYDGAIFGDVSFIGDNYDKLPLKVASTGKLDDSRANSMIISSRSSMTPDRDLVTSLSDSPLNGAPPPTTNGINGRSWISVESLDVNSHMRTEQDHIDGPSEYQDIDDDSLLADFKMPDISSSFDFGSSFMDEVLKALNEKESQFESSNDKNSNSSLREDHLSSSFNRSHSISPPKDSRTPPPPLPSQPPRSAPRNIPKEGKRDPPKVEPRKQAKVKPMSSSEEKMINSAIAMANEFDSKFVRQNSLSSPHSELNLSDSDSGSESPRLLSKLKASIKRSPKQERKRTFSDSINKTEVDDDIPPEAQEAYNMLVVQGSVKEASSGWNKTNGHNVLERESQSRNSLGSTNGAHNFAFADHSSGSSVSSTPNRVSRSSSERASASPPNFARLSKDRELTPERKLESRPVPRPRPEAKRSDIPVPKPRPEIHRVDPVPRPPPPPIPYESGHKATTITEEQFSSSVFDTPLVINEDDWDRSEESLKDDSSSSRSSQIEILRVDLPEERSDRSSNDSGRELTPKYDDNDDPRQKIAFFGDDFAEPSPREVMSKLARESRLRRSLDHQRSFTDGEPAPNRNLREPQGIPAKKSFASSNGGGDADEEVDTNPLRMLRGGGMIPVRGGRQGSGTTGGKSSLRHPKLHFTTSPGLQHSISVDTGTERAANLQSQQQTLGDLEQESSSEDTGRPPAIPARSYSVCDNVNPLPLPPKNPERPGIVHTKPRERKYPLHNDTTTDPSSDISNNAALGEISIVSVSRSSSPPLVITACKSLHDTDSSSYGDLPIAPPPPVNHQHQQDTFDSGMGDDNVFDLSGLIDSPRSSSRQLNLSRDGGTSGAATFPRGFKFGLNNVHCNLEQIGFYNHEDPFWVKSVYIGTDRSYSDRSTSDTDASPCMLANYKTSDGVSYEDLLDFALDRQKNGEEVEAMQKLLGSDVSADDCVQALKDTKWDVQKAIKFIKLKQLLSIQLGDVSRCKDALLYCDWDVQSAVDYLLGRPPPSPECVDV